MSDWERRHNSLAAKTFYSQLKSLIILGIVLLLITLALLANTQAGKTIDQAYSLTKNALLIIDNIADVSGYGKETMEAYYSVSEESREAQDIRYLSEFAKVRFDESFQDIVGMLKEFNSSSDVEDLYIAMYDPEWSRLVMIADGELNVGNAWKTGMWSEVSPSEVETFLSAEKDEKCHSFGNDPDYGLICTAGVPLYDQEGNITAFVLADVSLKGVIRGMLNFIWQYILVSVICMLVLGYVRVRKLKTELVDPINKIATSAEAYVMDKRQGNRDIRHFENLNISTGDEIENLYYALSDMENDINTIEQDLEQAAKDSERINTELNLAKKIQDDMLPSTFPAFPNRKDFDIFASMTPAKEVGGDFYDFYMVDDDHLAITIADVSGKGVPAALFMMAAKIFLNSEVVRNPSPGRALMNVNNQIFKNNTQDMFVTVWLGIVELSTGKLTAANAGHEYPMIMHAGKKFEMFRDKHGFVVGGMEDMVYKEYCMYLEPGAKLFIYTDGVAEAANGKNELFGLDRTLETLNKHRDESPEKVLKGINKALSEFTGNEPQFDDITMLCFSYDGPAADENEAETESEEEKYMNEMSIEAIVSNIPIVTDFVDEQLDAYACPPKAKMQINVAIDELFSNIAQYAYDPETGPATVRVEVEEDPLAVVITFIDHGKPYDPLARQDPDLTLGAEERPIGGLGIFLVKKTMDEINYEYKNGQNILKIRKNM